MYTQEGNSDWERRKSCAELLALPRTHMVCTLYYLAWGLLPYSWKLMRVMSGLRYSNKPLTRGIGKFHGYGYYWSLRRHSRHICHLEISFLSASFHQQVECKSKVLNDNIEVAGTTFCVRNFFQPCRSQSEDQTSIQICIKLRITHLH